MFKTQAFIIFEVLILNFKDFFKNLVLDKSFIYYKTCIKFYKNNCLKNEKSTL